MVGRLERERRPALVDLTVGIHDVLTKVGECVVCGCGLYAKPLTYCGHGPLCWGCWSKYKRGYLRAGEPSRPGLLRRIVNWLKEE